MDLRNTLITRLNEKLPVFCQRFFILKNRKIVN
jgi:hypothetical protein